MRAWQELGEQFHLLRYEDFVSGNIEALTGYLGFTVTSNVSVPEWIRRVGRTKSGGDWRNWFTGKDVEALRERCTPFLEFFGYPNDWELPRQRRIDPDHGSRYVSWIVELRRSGRG
jgi:hypothetical protein